MFFRKNGYLCNGSLPSATKAFRANRTPMYRILFLLLLIALPSCARRAKRPADTPPAGATLPAAVFLPAVPPDSLDGDARRAWLADHYWDRLDFGDSLFFARADSARMLEAFAAYAGGVLDPADPSPVRRLMERAARSRTSLDYFAWMASEVLYDPNSPLRDDELYIPVLEAQVASPLLDRWEKLAPQHDLRMARQNRVGRKANDLRYTLASGRTANLYSLRSDWVLLYIHNPDCAGCREVTEALVQSPMISELVERGALTVLTIYPDEDLDAWRRHLAELPATWINAYDRGARMAAEGTYDLRAIPSLYLLDAQKRVLAKDVTDVGRIEWLLDHAQ